MKASDTLIADLKILEGFTPVAKNLPGDRPEVVTVGYGETLGVKPGQRVAETEADLMLRAHVSEVAARVAVLVSVPLTQGQADALISFAYNCGTGALAASTLLRKLNSGDYSGASVEFSRWNMAAGKVLPGLSARRAKETNWFIGNQAA